MSPSRAGFSFHNGRKRLVFPDSFTPIRAVTCSASIQPLSVTERKFVTLNFIRRIVGPVVTSADCILADKRQSGCIRCSQLDAHGIWARDAFSLCSSTEGATDPP